jgi:hypothetical protein
LAFSGGDTMVVEAANDDDAEAVGAVRPKLPPTADTRTAAENRGTRDALDASI